MEHQDVLYNIMLHLSYNDVVQLCQLNKSAALVCRNNQFWKDKIITNNLPLIDLDKPNLMSTYMKRKEIKDNVEELLSNIYFQLDLKDKDLSFILPPTLQQYPNVIKQSVFVDTENYTIVYTVVDENLVNHQSYTTVTFQELINILAAILWYYPEIYYKTESLYNEEDLDIDDQLY
jgi:hypothetical protein